MRALIEIELARLLPSRDFRVSATVYALLLFLALLSLKAFAFELPGGSRSNVTLLAFPDVWHNAAYVAGWIGYLLYVMTLQIVTQEYQYHTARQHVVDGMSRRQYVTGKILLVILFAVGSTLLTATLACGFGVWAGGGFRDPAAASILALSGLQTLGYLSLTLFIGTVVRKTGAAVLAFTGYTLLAEPLLRDLALPAGAGHYLPSAAFASLVPNPFFGYAGMRIVSSVPHAIAASGLFACAFLAATMWTFARQDL